MQALRAALQPGVTGTSERRGNGLPDLLSTASGFGGQPLLRSGDGYAQVMAASPDRQFSARRPRAQHLGRSTCGFRARKTA